MNGLARTALVAGTAVTLMAGASTFTASAAPLGQNLDGLKSATPSNAVEVQRRHRHRGAAVALGAFGVGVVAGATLANRGYYYDGPYGYYEQPYGYYGYHQQPYGYYYYEDLDAHTGGTH